MLGVSERTIARNELEIYGENRCMRVDCYRFDGLEHTSSLNHPGGVKDRVRSIGRTLKALPLGALGLRYGGDFVDSYRAEWRHFINAIRTNTPRIDTGRWAPRAPSGASCLEVYFDGPTRQASARTRDEQSSKRQQGRPVLNIRDLARRIFLGQPVQ